MVEERIPLDTARKMNNEEKEELLRKIEQEAHDNEVDHWGCSQAVLSALQRYLALGDGEVFKAATAFAGGVARTGEVCGSLLGGVLAIGLAYGRAAYETGKIGHEQPDYLEVMIRASRLCDRFKERFGSLRCSDVKVAVGRIDFGRDTTRFHTLESIEDHAKCGTVTGPTARLTAEVMLEPTKMFVDEINARLEDMRRLREQQAKQQKS